MTPEQLEKERKASEKRRRQRFESQRRQAPSTEGQPVRGLTPAQRRKIQDDEFVAPKD